MSVAAAPPPVRSRPAAGLLLGPAVLGGVTWEDYVRFCDDPANEGVRLTFDQPSGRLEIGMPLGKRHEYVAEILAAFVLTFGRTKRVAITPVGSTTWRRRGVGGAEGDKAFHLSRPRAELSLDGNIPDLDGGDLPPDLVIEVDVTSPGLAKLPIYAGIGIPEVWVWSDDAIVVHRLTDDRYEVVAKSVELPDFPLTFAAELVATRSDAATFELEEAFAERLRTAD